MVPTMLFLRLQEIPFAEKEKNRIPRISHLSPEYRGGHLHVYPAPTLEHVPPL